MCSPYNALNFPVCLEFFHNKMFREQWRKKHTGSGKGKLTAKKKQRNYCIYWDLRQM